MTAEVIAIADRLISAGFERKVAEEVASVLSAAKGDTAQARADADADAKIAEARAEARRDNAKLEGEFTTVVERLEGQMRANFAEFRAEMKEDNANFRAEVNERFARLETQVKIMTNVIIAIGGAILVAVIVPLL